MATATYKVYIDVNADGDYSDANEDISAYVMSMSWNLGMSLYEPVAHVGTATFELKNDDRRFSPEYASSPYYDADTKTTLLPMKPMKITADAGGGEVTMWTGVLDRVEVMPGQYESRRAYIYARDLMELLNRRRLDNFSLQEDARSNAALDAVLDTVTKGNWWLGVGQHSRLGWDTYLGGPYFTTDLETGQTTFEYAGDGWFTEETTMSSAIQDIANSEGLGRFYCERDGTARFWDRHWQQMQTGVDAAIAADTQGAGLEYDWTKRSVYNEIAVTMMPVEPGDAAQTIFTHYGEAILVPAHGIRAMHCPYTFVDTGERAGAETVIEPVRGTDYNVNTLPDGTGESYDSYEEPTVTFKSYAEHAAITFSSGASGPLYIRNLKIRGTSLNRYRGDVVVADGESQTRYMLRDLTISAPLLTNPATARSIAKHMLIQRKAVRGIVGLKLTNKNATVLGHIVDRTIGDIITISETQTALATEKYYIVGENHEMRANGTEHECRWTLEPAPPYEAWLLGTVGRSEVGETTILGA